MLASILLLFVTAPLDVPEPSEQNFAKWREHIRPKAAELSFEACNWRPAFWDAVTEAQSTNKPVLLWAMNGHPMACT